MGNRRIAAILTAVATLLGVLALSPKATADVGISYDGWSGNADTVSGPESETAVVADGTRGPAVFAYDNFASTPIPGDPSTSGSGASGAWTFSAVQPFVGENIQLDWVYTGFHAFFQAQASIEAFVVDYSTEEPVETVIGLEGGGPVDCCAEPSAGFSYSGTVDLGFVPEGAEYGFRMTGSNADANSRLLGRLIVDLPGNGLQEDTLVVNGFDAGRAQNGESPADSDWADLITDPAAFGAATEGVVPSHYVVGDGVFEVNERSLLGTDIFVALPTLPLSEIGGPLEPTEKDALETFVENRGRLVATPDLGDSLFGVSSQPAFVEIPDSGFPSPHPIGDGPFGTVAGFSDDGPAESFGPSGSLPSAFGVVAEFFGESEATIVEALPGALGARSGLSVFIADREFLTALSETLVNETAIKNLFAYLADPPDGDPEPEPEIGTAQLLQAVPAGSILDEVNTYFTYVVLLAEGPPGETQTLEVFFSDLCFDGNDLGEGSAFLAEAEVTFDPDTGRAAFAGIIAGENGPVDDTDFVAARFRIDDEIGISGDFSECISAGPNNDSWTRALPLDLVGGGETRQATADGVLTASGEARWFKFDVIPGAKVEVELLGLPADYDLALFKDIRQTFQALEAGLEDVDDLNQLSAEFAPSAFAPSAFAPSAFAPSAFAPSAFAPSAFAPSAFAPSAFAPSAFAPSAFAPSAFAPSAFAPSAFAPSAFAPSAFAPSAFAPSAFAPSAFAAENFASAQTTSLLATSAQFGTGGEAVVADTWNNTGEFYVRVSGKNGAFDPEDDFTVRVRVDGAQCADVDPIPGAPFTAPSAGYRTVIITDNGRIDGALAGNDGAALAALESNLAAYAARPEVAGVVVDLADFPHIAQLHAQADANPSCPYAENLTAEAIRDVIGAYRVANPSVEFVTLVGSDTQVPFFRYPDQALLGPEQDYEPPVANGTQSQSSLRLNYVLGQDEYGSATTLSLQDSILPIPNLAVGRLVETASDMNTVLGAYLATNDGIVTPESSLVTGYDFLTDAANKVQDELSAGLGQAATRTDTLITPADKSPQDPASWTADQLRTELLDEGEDLIFLAGHFSANSALAADFETEVLATELAESDTDLTNAVVFSNGCHSGYNIANDDVVPGVTEPLDWTQAFAQKGATLIAGTGYQYGDTDFIEYSERIYTQFSEELRRGQGPVSVGQALVRAKQEYLATTPELEGLHRKSLLISTLFGLPNLRVDMPGERLVDPPAGSDIARTLVASDPGNELGLEKAPVSLDFSGDLTERIVPLEDIENGGTVDASYLVGPDGVLTNLGKPALPLASKNVSQQGTALRGVGFRGGAWTEDIIEAPLTGAPATEIRGVHTPFASLVNFPMKLTSVNYFGAITGTGGTRLNVTPAQHRVENIGDIATIRRTFSTVDLDLFYSANTTNYAGNVPALAAPPAITGVQSQVVGDDIRFRTRVVGDPSAGIQEVWITYTDGSGVTSGVWMPLDFTQDPDDSTVWTATLVNGAVDFTVLDFVIHAANGVGLVSTDDKFGAYYQVFGSGVTPPDDPDPTELGLSVASSAAFGATVQASAQLTDATGAPVAGERVLFSLGATGRATTTNAGGVATVNIPITSPPGSYTLTASFAGTDELEPSDTAADLTVVKASTQTTVSTTAPSVTPSGIATGIGAEVTALGDSPLLRRTVYFTLVDDAGTTRTFPRITDNVGRARLGTVSLPPGSYEVTARFLGSIPKPDGTTFAVDDPAFLASSGTTQLDVGGFNEPPAIDGIGAPGDPVEVGETVTLDVTASDPNPGDTLDVTVDWGDGSAPTQLPDQSNPVAANPTHVYDTADVYTVTVTVCDAGACADIAVEIVAIDRRAGSMAGAGRITSPAGAVVDDPGAKGRATFAYAATYRRWFRYDDMPRGFLVFRLRTANLKFTSTEFDWMALTSGQVGQLAGSGKINNAGDYDFVLTTIDRRRADALRLQIWDAATGDLVYDTNPGSDPYGDDAVRVKRGFTAITGPINWRR